MYYVYSFKKKLFFLKLSLLELCIYGVADENA